MIQLEAHKIAAIIFCDITDMICKAKAGRQVGALSAEDIGRIVLRSVLHESNAFTASELYYISDLLIRRIYERS